MALTTPVVPDNAFSGQRGLTEGTAVDGVGHLAEVLQNVRTDLLKTDSGFSGAGILGGAKQQLLVDLPGGAGGNVDIAIPAGVQLRVTDFMAIMQGAGAASDTVQLKKVVTGPTETDISDALDTSAADTLIVRGASIDDAEWELDGDAGDILRVTQVDAAGADAPAILAVIEFLAL